MFNYRIIALTSFITLITVTTLVLVVATIRAQSNMTFLQADPATVTVVDPITKTITISYAPSPQSLAPCSPTYCPPRAEDRKPDVLTQGQVLLLNGFHNGVENDFTKIKIGDRVTVYLRYDGTAKAPYMVIDGDLLPPGCKATDLYCSGQGSSGGGVVTTITIDQDLKVGVQSDQVFALQKKLQTLGYFPSNQQPTGYFGAITKKTVIDFQRAKGLPATGFVGHLTRNALKQ